MDGDRVCRGVLRVRTEEGKGGRGATASSGSLFERGWERQGAVGVGRRGQCMRALPAEQRGRGEADGWAAATVPSGGATDERGLSGSGRGREERGADRRDRPISGSGWRGGCGLRGARVGRPGKEKGGPSLDE
jgi:hypothetical protein